MTEYPGIRRACSLIARDNGGINRDRTQLRWHRDYTRWISNQDGPLEEIDAWLVGLSREQIELVCAGGHDEPETVAILAKAPAFTDDLLNRYFDEVC